MARMPVYHRKLTYEELGRLRDLDKADYKTLPYGIRDDSLAGTGLIIIDMIGHRTIRTDYPVFNRSGGVLPQWQEDGKVPTSGERLNRFFSENFGGDI